MSIFIFVLFLFTVITSLNGFQSLFFGSCPSGRTTASTITSLFLFVVTEVEAPLIASYFFCPSKALSKLPRILT